jgi:DNA end-binding protein Ku
MARPIWSGTISFGLVTVPVKLFSAVNRKTVRFHQLHESTGVRIQQKRVDPQTGEEVPYDEIVRGYEIAPDRYVVIAPEELEALDPKKTRTIDIEDFVDLGDIDPIFYDHPYYLVPGQGGAKPYRLLLEAMRETSKVAVARIVIRSKEQLVAVRPMGDVLGMTTMIFADEVVDPEKLEDLPDPDDVKTTDRELDIAKQLVESLSGRFEPDKYHDSYREEVLALIERKAAGEQIAVQPALDEEQAPVPDLMSALKASLDAVRKDGGEVAKGNGAAKGDGRDKGRAGARSGSSGSKRSSSSSSSSSSKRSSSRAKAKK